IRLAQQHRVPAVYFLRTSVAQGSLMAYGTRSLRQLLAISFLCRSHLEGSQAGRSSRSATHEIRTGHQPQVRENTRPPNSRQAAGPRRRGHRMTAKMKRREFITLLGGSAAWPLAARAQQGERMRRIGVLTTLADDEVGKARHAAFGHGVRDFGWIEGRNVRIDTRWGTAHVELTRKYARELVALAPDVILAGAGGIPAAIQATSVLPIVFVQSVDPIGAGFVQSLARPGGNATG